MPSADHEFAIRAATAADAPRIAAHRMELLAIDAPEGDVIPAAFELERDCEAAVARLLTAGRAGAWLAIAPDGSVVGSTVLLYVDRLPSLPNPSAVEGYLAQLHVIEAWRWRGVGMALMRAALDDAQARKLGRVRLHSTNDAMGFYERCGFRQRTRDLELKL